MTEYFNDNGDFRYVSTGFALITIRTTCEFHVVLNDKLIGPNSSTQRLFRHALKPNDELDVFCDERYSIAVKPLAATSEHPDGESLVEVIEEGELSMYEQLRQEMLGKLSQYATSKDMDTFDEAEDFGWEEEDETPLTPYEYEVMQEEMLQLEQDEAPTPQTQPEVQSSESVVQKDSSETTLEAAEAKN